jgi:hypothetical protein
MARPTLEAVGARLHRIIYGSPVASVQTQLESVALDTTAGLSAEDSLIRLQELAGKRIGFDFSVIPFPDGKYPEGANLPNGWAKPEAWLYDQIRKGKLPETTTDLPGTTVLMEGVQKPNVRSLGTSYYEDPIRDFHQHLYAVVAQHGISVDETLEEQKRRALFTRGDPLARWLAAWRASKDIPTIAGVPNDSRFGLSAEEIDHLVLPQVARMLNVKPDQVRLPRAIEFVYTGNTLHPEWGITDSSEWFADQFEQYSRLTGGGHHQIYSTNPNGLGSIDCAMPKSRSASRGFRIMVLPEFPQQS